jgi:hypothetical protein
MTPKLIKEINAKGKNCTLRTYRLTQRINVLFDANIKYGTIGRTKRLSGGGVEMRQLYDFSYL